ncbi:HAD family hydrolase [Sphaerisporangium rhizosphaerae]|uniref:HAD family hydrolase n=1 Tax=Sphaerisporangium rhizosphaerae TaxID=2269375 RepID=A0ABW2PFL0_9ACTN
MVFDLDGTLLDTWTVHRHSLRQAAVTVGLVAPSAATLATVQRATDLDTLRALVGDERLDRADSAYGAALRAALSTRSVPAMPGAAEAVARLRAADIAVGVCTGRSRRDAQRLLDASDLLIDLTVAREEAHRPKPAPDGLLRALELLDLTADTALYVGDSAADVAQGRDAGVRTLLLARPSRVPGLRASADGPPHLASLCDLPDLVRRDST